MFTGLVEEVGIVRDVHRSDGHLKFTVESPSISKGLRVDDSVSVDGCCQTVTECEDFWFRAIAVPETLKKTSLGGVVVGSRVNLERAVAVGSRMGGHFVQGHVDKVSTVNRIELLGVSKAVWINVVEEDRRLIVPAGSIALNGVSLTVAELSDSEFKVAVIPHTLSRTTIGALGEGDIVNVEFDMIGKYVVNAVASRASE